MNRNFIRTIAAAAMAMAFSGQAAHAQQQYSWWNWFWGNQDPRLTVTGMAVGAGATAGYYALRRAPGPNALNAQPIRLAPAFPAYVMTTVGCQAAFPIIGTLWLNRPLTTREIYTGMANCVVPFVGGWAVDYAFHGQAWYDGTPVRYAHH
jgi:hypothetical protein